MVMMLFGVSIVNADNVITRTLMGGAGDDVMWLLMNLINRDLHMFRPHTLFQTR